MGLPYENEDYGGAGGGGASTINDLVGMNFSTLSNNEIMKKVDSNNVGGSGLYTLATSTGNVDRNFIYSVVNNNPLGDIRFFEDNNINEYRIELYPNPNTSNSLNIREDGTSAKVGINVLNPEEALHIAGTARIDNDSTQSLTFYDTGGGNTRQHGRIELVDNGGGADMKFYTRPSGGTEPTDKLTINKDGAIGLGATPDFGVAGNFLMSLGSGSSPEWFVPTVRIITSVKKTEFTQSFVSGGIDKITNWDTPHVDIGTTGWSGANSRYTIKRTATYRIDFKGIITNTQNDQNSLRYLNAGIYIYNSNGTLASNDLDTTILFNVDNTSGRPERGSADYTIIRSLDADQYIELQVASLQQGTGNYLIESAVFNIEEVGAYNVAGVGQFLSLTGGTITGPITSPTYITSAIPTLTTQIGYNNSIAVATNIILPVFNISPYFVVLGSYTLNAGVYIVYGSFTTDGFATYGATAILHDGTATLTENFTVVVSGGFTSSYVTDTVVVPVGTTKTIEFRANVNVVTSPAVETVAPTKYNVVRVA